tara:strand:+ start:748 stop:1008 length:261 start_codon:yes stop_codon:yes gene_type:complete
MIDQTISKAKIQLQSKFGNARSAGYDLLKVISLLETKIADLETEIASLKADAKSKTSKKSTTAKKPVAKKPAAKKAAPKKRSTTKK